MSQADAAPITGESINTGGNSAHLTDHRNAHAPSRRSVLAGAGIAMLAPAAAAATSPAPSIREAWDRALYAYRWCQIREKAYFQLGPYNWANDNFDLAQLRKEEDPEQFEQAFQLLRHQEDDVSPTYFIPMRDAALALVQLPAPDLDAVAFKMELHKDNFDASVHDKMTWHCIMADLKRLKP